MASEISDAKPDGTADGAHGRDGREPEERDDLPPGLRVGEGESQEGAGDDDPAVDSSDSIDVVMDDESESESVPERDDDAEPRDRKSVV